jgi:hypothetical protein
VALALSRASHSGLLLSPDSARAAGWSSLGPAAPALRPRPSSRQALLSRSLTASRRLARSSARRSCSSSRRPDRRRSSAGTRTKGRLLAAIDTTLPPPCSPTHSWPSLDWSLGSTARELSWTWLAPAQQTDPSPALQHGRTTGTKPDGGLRAAAHTQAAARPPQPSCRAPARVAQRQQASN